MYLMTNSKSSQCGVYELPKRIIETETGYNRETVEKLIARFEGYKKIVYCDDSKEIVIVNWMKHNKANSPKVKKCIEKELGKIKNREFVGLFLEVCKDIGYSMDSVSIDYGEKEKEKEKQKEKQKQNSKLLSKCESNLARYARLYEENIGLINGVASEWLVEVSETVDVELFKRAIEIATNNSKCNKGYVSGIINQWRSNNIKSLKDLKAYKLSKEQGGSANVRFKRDANEEDSDYTKPTEKELDEFREFLKEKL